MKYVAPKLTLISHPVINAYQAAAGSGVQQFG